MSSPRYDDSLFRGTATFYAEFRPGIPAPVAELIAGEAGADATGTLLDVGTGTGQVLLALADRFELGVGIDPDPSMLVQARHAVAKAGLAERVLLELGQAPDLPRRHAPYRLVTFSRVFHWLDRAATARAVLEVLEPGGSVAVFGDGSFWTGEEDWQEIVRDVIQRWLGPGRRAGANRYVPPVEPFEDALRNAGFVAVREFSVVEQRAWTVKTILGYLYSTSFASPDLFGGDLGRFDADLTEALRAASPDGTFHERATFGIWMGDKPTEGAT
jgi:SAM-dependent methyltransferase